MSAWARTLDKVVLGHGEAEGFHEVGKVMHLETVVLVVRCLRRRVVVEIEDERVVLDLVGGEGHAEVGLAEELGVNDLGVADVVVMVDGLAVLCERLVVIVVDIAVVDVLRVVVLGVVELDEVRDLAGDGLAAVAATSDRAAALSCAAVSSVR